MCATSERNAAIDAIDGAERDRARPGREAINYIYESSMGIRGFTKFGINVL